MALVCAVAGLTMVGGFFIVDAVEEAIYNCNPDPYFPEWCEAPDIVYLSILIGPWLVATYLLARREAIVRSIGSGFTYGWFACVFMGLMWWLGCLTFLVLWIPGPLDITFLGVAVVGGAVAVPVIGFLTALGGSGMQALIRWRREKRLSQAA